MYVHWTVAQHQTWNKLLQKENIFDSLLNHKFKEATYMAWFVTLMLNPKLFLWRDVTCIFWNLFRLDTGHYDQMVQPYCTINKLFFTLLCSIKFWFWRLIYFVSYVSFFISLPLFLSLVIYLYSISLLKRDFPGMCWINWKIRKYALQSPVTSLQIPVIKYTYV